MHVQRVFSKKTTAVVAGIATLILLAGCTSVSGGSQTSTDGNQAQASTGGTGTPSATSTACPSGPGGRGTMGTLKNINGTTLVIADMQGQSTTVTYDANTSFTKQVKVDSTAIQQGATVSVIA